MAGGSRRHARLSANLLRDLGNQLRSGSCEIYTSDMRVRVTHTGLYTYPDVIAVCGQPRFIDDNVDTHIASVVTACGLKRRPQRHFPRQALRLPRLAQ